MAIHQVTAIIDDSDETFRALQKLMARMPLVDRVPEE
jgi:hypothetical protein